MAWFKVDDGFHASDKLLGIPARHKLAAAGLWVVAGSWAANQLTDGRVPEYMLKVWGATPAVVDSLVNAGLWEREQGAFVFRSWHEYQPSKADVDAERAASRQRMRDIRAKRKQPKPQDDAEVGEVFGRTGANGSESVRNPDPTRPDPTHIEEAKASSLFDSDESNRDGELLPESWMPSQKHYDHAVSLGLDPQRELERFREASLRKQRRLKNWNTAFTNWLKKAAEFNQQRQTAGQVIPFSPQNVRQSPGQKARSVADELRKEGL